MNDLMIDGTSDDGIFDFDGSPVRVLAAQDGVVLFVAADVATALGYANTDKAVRDHCKRMKTFKANELSGLGLANPPTRGMVLIPESDVYRLAMRSTLESAMRFQDWVMESVLPQIRRTSEYRSWKQGKDESELEWAERMLGMKEQMLEEGRKYVIALREKDAYKQRIDRSVLFGRVVPEDGGNRIAVKDIQEQLAPWCPPDKIRLILNFYSHPKTTFQIPGAPESDASKLTVFEREGLEDVFDRFLDDADAEVSASRRVAIVRHECLLGSQIRVRRDKAIRYLDFDESDFE